MRMVGDASTPGWRALLLAVCVSSLSVVPTSLVLLAAMEAVQVVLLRREGTLVGSAISNGQVLPLLAALVVFGLPWAICGNLLVMLPLSLWLRRRGALSLRSCVMGGVVGGSTIGAALSPGTVALTPVMFFGAHGAVIAAVFFLILQSGGPDVETLFGGSE